MRVRIIECSNEKYWYADKIGREYEIMGPYSTGSDNDVYFVPSENATILCRDAALQIDHIPCKVDLRADFEPMSSKEQIYQECENEGKKKAK